MSKELFDHPTYLVLDDKGEIKEIEFYDFDPLTLSRLEEKRTEKSDYTRKVGDDPNPRFRGRKVIIHDVYDLAGENEEKIKKVFSD